MDFKTTLSKKAFLIDQTLKAYFIQKTEEVKKVDPSLSLLLKEFESALYGGKRLRGSLVLIIYEILGGKGNIEVLKIAAALEIFQTAILAHDDIIDQSKIRRGKNSLYQSLGGDENGKSLALCLGDLGFFLSNDLILQSRIELETKLKILEVFNKSNADTTLGEMLDIILPLKKEFTEERALKIAFLKTANYSLVSPLKIGSILAGQKNLKSLEGFGKALGIAFQIKDDILGVFGESLETGKSNLSDITEGKVTLLIAYALEKPSLKDERSSTAYKQILKKYYGKSGLEKSEIEAVKQAMKKTGAFDYAKAQALKYLSLAKVEIPKITKDPKNQKLLAEFSDYLIERIN